MARNNQRPMAIPRVGGRSTALTELSREFYIVRKTVTAAAGVILPFIVWQRKIHAESYS